MIPVLYVRSVVPWTIGCPEAIPNINVQMKVFQVHSGKRSSLRTSVILLVDTEK